MPYLDWVVVSICLVKTLVVAFICFTETFVVVFVCVVKTFVIALFVLLTHCILRPSPLGEGLGVRPIWVAGEAC